jgi:hypothetical protein
MLLESKIKRRKNFFFKNLSISFLTFFLPSFSPSFSFFLSFILSFLFLSLLHSLLSLSFSPSFFPSFSFFLSTLIKVLLILRNELLDLTFTQTDWVARKLWILVKWYLSRMPVRKYIHASVSRISVNDKIIWYVYFKPKKQ